ncbi:MAG: hypothetical protein O6931_05170 [Gammaproteobacteria bacterium]|nr:hypothetical protein [Gammaproteobacteria bacterium]
MMSKARAIFCGLLLTTQLLFASQLAAQDTDELPAVEQTVQVEQEDPTLTELAGESPATEDSEASQDQPRTIDDLDSFVPSEEVSSDLSISYPVDI